MTRARIIAIAVLLLATVVIASWILWRTQPTEANADERFQLVLILGAGRPPEVLVGAPVTFETYLTAPKGAPSFSIGGAGRPWHSALRLVDPQSGRSFAWRTNLLGAPESTVFSMTSDGRLRITHDTGDVAIVDHDHVHHVTFAASPEVMSKVTPGTYRVQALLDGQSWPPWRRRGPLESPPITIVVRDRDTTTNRDRLERDRLRASAEFYVLAKRFEDARRAAEELSSREPKNAGVLILLGDALVGLGRRADALSVYRHALAISPRTYEEPTLLYERIQGVLSKESR